MVFAGKHVSCDMEGCESGPCWGFQFYRNPGLVSGLSKRLSRLLIMHGLTEPAWRG
jgi:hypothetical protein